MISAKHSVIKCVIVMATILGLGVTAIGRSQSDPQMAEMFRQRVEAAIVRQRMETSFLLTVYAPTPSSEIAPTKMLESRSFDLSIDGVRLLVSEHLPATDDGAFPAMDQLSSWDGQTWRAQDARVGDLMIDSSQPYDMANDCWALFHQFEMLSIVGKALSAIPSFGEVVDHSSNGQTELFTVWLNASKTTKGTFWFDSANPGRPTTVQKDIFGGSNSDVAGVLVATVTFCVDEWGDFSGQTMPKRARRVMTTYPVGARKTAGEKLMVATVAFERLSASFPRGGRLTVDVPTFSDKAGILDQTLHAAYHLKSDMIVLDGFLFRVNTPIENICREKLQTIMRGAQSIDRPAIPDMPDQANDCADAGIVELILAGTGRPAQDFYLAEKAVLLSANAPATVILVALTGSDQQQPPMPDWKCAEKVDVAISEWELIYSQDQTRKRPARWQATATLSAQQTDFDTADEITFSLGGNQERKVNLSGRP